EALEAGSRGGEASSRGRAGILVGGVRKDDRHDTSPRGTAAGEQRADGARECLRPGRVPAAGEVRLLHRGKRTAPAHAAVLSASPKLSQRRRTPGRPKQAGQLTTWPGSSTRRD